MSDEATELEREFVTLRDEALQRAELVVASLPESFEIAMLSLNSKLPFKALSVREVLIHRIADLTLSAAECLRAERVISAATLTRGAMETLARVMELEARIARFLAEPDVKAMNDYLDCSLLGSRTDAEMPRAINILTAIQKADKEIPDFEKNYENMCEYAHPNWSGGLGTFGQIDQENFRLILKNPERAYRALRTTALLLNATLGAFEAWYNRLADSIKAFNEHFENNKDGAA